MLLNFLDTDLFERQGKALTNFQRLLPDPQSDLAQAMTKDPYNFDFLTLREKYDEKELKDALLANTEKFLLLYEPYVYTNFSGRIPFIYGIPA